jgi:LPS O-antigen subunit length determinant protein (WzzB/FepE family)
MKKSLTLLLASSVLLLSACGEQEINSSKYYAENPEEAEQTIDKCIAKLSPGTANEIDQNCKNAFSVKKTSSGANNKDYTGDFD